MPPFFLFCVSSSTVSLCSLTSRACFSAITNIILYSSPADIPSACRLFSSSSSSCRRIILTISSPSLSNLCLSSQFAHLSAAFFSRFSSHLAHLSSAFFSRFSSASFFSCFPPTPEVHLLLFLTHAHPPISRTCHPISWTCHPLRFQTLSHCSCSGSLSFHFLPLSSSPSVPPSLSFFPKFLPFLLRHPHQAPYRYFPTLIRNTCQVLLQFRQQFLHRRGFHF